MHPFHVEPESGSGPSREKTYKDCNKTCATWEFYEPPENFPPVEFCLDTSLHGLQYVGQPQRHLFERLFWLAAFIAAVSAAAHLIHTMWGNFFQTPIMTVFAAKETRLDEIPFPAVTICNVNNIDLSKWSAYANQTRELLKKHSNTSNDEELLRALAVLGDVYDICSTKTFAKRLVRHAGKEWAPPRWKHIVDLVDARRGDYAKYSNHKKILNDASQNCTSMILFCMWLDEIRNCSELFQEVETDYGICCTFNAIPRTLLLKYMNDSRDSEKRVKGWLKTNLSVDNYLLTDENIEYPFRQKYPGRTGGLTVLLDPDIKEYSCTNTDSEGFAVGISGPLDFPKMKDNGILIGTGSEVFINVRPEVILSEPPIRKYSLDKRNCFFANEKSLPHYSHYTTSNCVGECIALNTLEQCHCVTYDMPRKPEDPLCKPDKYSCTEEVRKNITQKGLFKGCTDCLATCTDIEYNSEVMSLNIREFYTNRVFDAYPKHTKAKSGNISIVHVYIGTDSTYPRVRTEVYTIIDLISNTGGLMGLCMGFSMLSLLEILYHCTLRLGFRHRRKRLENEENNSQNQENDNITIGTKQRTTSLQNFFSKIFARYTSGAVSTPVQHDTIFRLIRHRNSSGSSGINPYYNPPYQTAFGRGYEATSIVVRRGTFFH